MTSGRLWACAVLLCSTLLGCNSSSSNLSSSSSPSSDHTLQRPAATANDVTWGNYLAAQGKLHGQDVSQRPYIYVIPRGEGGGAVNRRHEESDSVVQSIGPILVPGGMLILGGPDAKQTTVFISNIAKQLKADVMKGIVVMVVSDASEQTVVTSALKSSGATVRFVTM